MKIQRRNLKKAFSPIEIVITLETLEEAEEFYFIFNYVPYEETFTKVHSQKIVDAINKDLYIYTEGKWQELEKKFQQHPLYGMK